MTSTTTSTSEPTGGDPERTGRAPVPVMVAEPGLRRDLQAVKVVMHRELIRFGQDRLRFVSALVQPVLFLFVLGTGLSALTDGSTQGLDLRTFMYPGILATSTMFTAVFSAVSIVWDREFGFLREMLVAPVRRGSIILGKALGGATVATLQSIVILVLAPVVGVGLTPLTALAILALVFLLSFTLTALGLVVVARIQQIQTVMGIMQMLVLPLSFLSGALYPIGNLPDWLGFLVRINPVTYAVQPVRTVAFSEVDAPAATLARLNPPLTWWGWEVPTALQIGLVAVMGMAMLAIAVRQFQKVD
jgi:ABC-2 type transport system permease protein